MIIQNLHLVGIAFFEAKTQPPLVIDPDAELTLALPSQRFQAIAGRNSKIFNGASVIEHLQFAFGNGGNGLELLGSLSCK
jgi:hypothetical protein